MTKNLSPCRLQCGGFIESFFYLGDFAMTGKFPNENDLNNIRNEKLDLGICSECELIQLANYIDPKIYFTKDYGYESSLNNSMKLHLQKKITKLANTYLHGSNPSNTKPIVVDIASNDGTLLSALDSTLYTLVGIDPLIENFKEKYPTDVVRINSFFDQEIYFENIKRQASLVTSCAVLYDLNEPNEFIKDISEILIENGIWHFEQSYLYSMIKQLSYDTICHEHFLYLSLQDIFSMLRENSFWIEDVEINSINGGSIAVTARKKSFPRQSFDSLPVKAKQILQIELETDTRDQMNQFKVRSRQHAKDLKALLIEFRRQGKNIYGLGASTKGNVLLQFCGLDRSNIKSIGEVNKTKIGKVTPGTGIPIVHEELVLEDPKRSVLLVLPWHFKDSFIELTKNFRKKGGTIIFPLPKIEIL